MSRRKLLSSLLLGCLFPFILGACRSEPPQAGAGGAGGAAGGDSKSSDVSAARAGKNFKIVIVTNGSSPFWDACDRGLKDAGAKLGVNVELVRNDATE
ncbi:MAG: hypothetical protein EHM42_13540, partial [Planctomycetaceae bacterium]